MKQTINSYQFEQAFITAGRENNFSYAGRKALFEYLEGCEEETGEELQLDVIALCCGYAEYANVKEFAEMYGDDYIVWETEPEEAVEGGVDVEATLDKIRDETQVIDIDGESFIIEAF